MEAKDHAVFTELTRVKQYFEKIKKLEEPTPEREKTVNTEAAARFIRADLVCSNVLSSCPPVANLVVGR